MCFSASASFAASVGLAAIGGASWKVAKKEEKIIAIMPFAFAIQQAFEGVQWLRVGAGCPSFFFGYGFLFFACIFWPVYFPVAVYAVDKKRRKALLWLILLGISIAAFLLFLLLTEPLVITSIRQSMWYTFYLPIPLLLGVWYVAATLVPLIVSSHREFRIFAAVGFVTAIIAAVFFSTVFISVWCFFAAIVSALAFFYLNRKNRN